MVRGSAVKARVIQDDRDPADSIRTAPQAQCIGLQAVRAFELNGLSARFKRGSNMGITDGLMSAANVLRAADKIPEFQQILDAMGKMAELQAELSAAQERNRALEKELEAIRADQKSAEGIRRDCDLYVLGHEKYCPGCWEMHKRLAPVVSVRSHGVMVYQCCRCKQEFSFSHNS